MTKTTTEYPSLPRLVQPVRNSSVSHDFDVFFKLTSLRYKLCTVKLMAQSVERSGFSQSEHSHVTNTPKAIYYPIR